MMPQVFTQAINSVDDPELRHAHVLCHLRSQIRSLPISCARTERSLESVTTDRLTCHTFNELRSNTLPLHNAQGFEKGMTMLGQTSLEERFNRLIQVSCCYYKRYGVP